uniref:Pyruvate kinase barrel domain-containing protein n=1 Tax=Hucho hucho TaxID=62062 RepID=A0A4W5R0S9_9TELE
MSLWIRVPAKCRYSIGRPSDSFIMAMACVSLHPQTAGDGEALSLSRFVSLLQYHGENIKNIREAVETITTDPLYYRPVAIALDTKGPEIRTGLVRGVIVQFRVSVNRAGECDQC